MQKRPPIKIKDMVVAHPTITPKYDKRKLTIEDPGFGDTLCYEAWGGRLFFHDEDMVRDIVKRFEESYAEACLKSAEDPAGVYVEVFNYNDNLYYPLGILPTVLGDAWGYNSAIDYARDLHFNVTLTDPKTSEIAEQFGRPVLVIEPEDDDSYPDYYYREY